MELNEELRVIFMEGKDQINKHLVKNLVFIDDTITIPIKYTRELMEKMKEYCEEHEINSYEFIHRAIHAKLHGE
jgi:hypothetical protein